MHTQNQVTETHCNKYKLQKLTQTYKYNNTILPKVMTLWVGPPWIPNPRVLGSKSSGPKVDSAFYPSEVDQMSTRYSLEFSGKNKLSSHSDLVAWS